MGRGIKQNIKTFKNIMKQEEYYCYLVAFTMLSFVKRTTILYGHMLGLLNYCGFSFNFVLFGACKIVNSVIYMCS